MDVSEVVKSLTQKQRMTLVGEAVCESGVTKLRHEMGPSMRCALQRRGVVVDRMYSEELTALGVDVRTTLLHARALSHRPKEATDD